MSEDINVQTVNVMSPRVQLLKNDLSAKDGGREHGMNLMGSHIGLLYMRLWRPSDFGGSNYNCGTRPRSGRMSGKRECRKVEPQGSMCTRSWWQKALINGSSPARGEITGREHDSGFYSDLNSHESSRMYCIRLCMTLEKRNVQKRVLVWSRRQCILI
jgi:hypothetical protein